jgi:hypothetical protein
MTADHNDLQEGRHDVYEELKGSEQNILGCRFSGTVTDAEFKTFVARAERSIAAYGKIRLLIVMDLRFG